MLVIASPAEFNGQGAVRDAVVTILGCKWPLSLKAVFFAVTKEYALSVSYQAVHKALKQLVENGIAVKEDGGYCLNIKWIKKIKQFGSNLEQAYERNQINGKIKQLA